MAHTVKSALGGTVVVLNRGGFFPFFFFFGSTGINVGAGGGWSQYDVSSGSASNAVIHRRRQVNVEMTKCS